MADDIVQIIENARVDATSLSEFIYYPATVTVNRRLAPPIHTLNYYLQYLEGLEKVYSQPTGTVEVNGEVVKTVRQSVNDAIDSAILGDYQTTLEAKLVQEVIRATNRENGIEDVLDAEVIRSTNAETAISQDLSELSLEVEVQKLDTGITATPQYTNSVPRTQAQINSERVSLEDFNNGLRSDEDIIRFAFTSGAHEVLVPYGKTYNISSIVDIENPTVRKIYGGGEFVFSENGVLNLRNTLTTLSPKLAQNYSGVTSLDFNDVTELSADDVIIVWNPNEYSLSEYRNYYRDGYMAKVANVSSTTKKVRLYGRTPKVNDSAINAYAMKNKPITIDGLKVTSIHSKVGIVLSHYVGVNIENITSPTNLAYAGIKIDKCYDINANFLRNSANASNAYPLQIANCQLFRLTGCSTSSIRHAIGIGGDGGVGSVPSRDGVISHCQLMNDAKGATVGVPVGDAHGNALNIKYYNSTLNMGGQFGGRDCELHNCDIYSIDNADNGIAVLSSELIGGNIKMYDCNLFLSRTVLTASRAGIIQLAAPKRTEDLFVDIKNLSIEWINDSVALSNIHPLLIINDSNTSKNITIIIDGVQERGSLLKKKEIIRLAKDVNDSSMQVYITIKNIHNLNYSEYCTSAFPQEQVKYRLKGESGRTTIPVAQGELVTSRVQVPLAMGYPKLPAANLNTYQNLTYGIKGWVVKSAFLIGSPTVMELRASSLDDTSPVGSSGGEIRSQWSVELMEF